MDVAIEEIIAKIKEYNQSSNSQRIRAAYQLAAAAHAGQKRDSGGPYIGHPLAVANILVGMQIDDDTVIAGLLHDVVEDTRISLEELGEMFGSVVPVLVSGVTKLSKLEFHNRHEAQAENLRKMFMAMASDIRIILIKLADRLHNMRTIGTHHSKVRQKEIAEETLNIFAPLAHRLGMFNIKSDLEDLSITILEPEIIAKIKEQLAAGKSERDHFINNISVSIRRELGLLGIKCDVTGRSKNYYSIYNKMRRQQKELNEIFDINAIRVIVGTVKDCYGVLGVIHTMWKPIPGRFKDYVAMPKQNFYQSIHTTVIGDNGTPFEVQIRTWDMHRIAEYGIAAHWRYKEGKSADADFDKRVEWLRQMLEWQQELGDAGEFMETVKGDLFNEYIYVFSPKGDVYELPAIAGPLDFAYRIHTEVGHQCVGCKVNHRLVPLETKLNNGDIVEVMIAKGSGPSRDWLKMVHTQQAKNKIRQWFRKEKREENIILGKDALERECRKYSFNMVQVFKQEYLLEIAKRFNFMNTDDMFAALGDGALALNTVLNRIKENYKKELMPPPELKITPEQKSVSAQGVWVKGVGDALVRLAACCKPLPGDNIIGYVTRGRGVSVHRQDCSNARRYAKTEAARLIEVGWGQTKDGIYQVELLVSCMDRDRLTLDIVSIMAETKTPINGIHASVDKRTGHSQMHLKLEVKSLDQMDYIIQRIKRVDDVLEVIRIGNKGL
ncbi:MAG: bifunctional (p)ppGpp synthetase/guanosine-3',5'-bis(diphosphate) 3'-pyrophosphohydrolase [Clostridiales bacterium]|nr:bifunctional (p)ppGpp synthetase/guanosine-3',5'-bis(diphosphate) 3'-pyrophosphohydrolase [Clostridiales bacterium]